MSGRELFPKVIPQLDGVRGIAILLVLISHAEGYRLIDWHLWGHKGWIGVDLFFVLSGFLITGILADAKGRPNFFRNFYGRRILRILPLYAAVLAASYWLMRAAVLPENAAAYSWLPYVLLVQNIAISGPGFHALGATWSLAIEEHFYLVWPWLMRKLGNASLIHVLLLIVLLSPLARWMGWYLEFSRFLMFKHTLLRLDGLALGALLALWMRMPAFTVRRLQIAAWSSVAAGLPLAVWMVWKDTYIGEVFNKTAVSLLCFGIVGVALLASRKADGVPARLLATPPLRYVGQVSYCLYLVHIPVLDVVTSLPVQERIAMMGFATLPTVQALYLLGSFGLATFSWYGFERPILRWKHRFSEIQPTDKAKAAATI
jgi:peptidoglycan/LPS O-acetylase OafA/YrhL